MVVTAERFVAIGTFARPRREALIDAFFAEHVAAGLDDSIFEVSFANRTYRECLF